ncbi:MAG: hypothetical protein ACQEVA_08365 [Myxococcota bacterium]
MIYRHTIILSSLLLGGALLCATGCGDSIDAPDGATTIRNLQPTLSDDSSTFTFEYEIMDPEGDDKRLRFEVCEADDNGASVECGTPVQGPGGDGTDFVPTVPGGEFVVHVFRWDLGCGRFVGTERRNVEADTDYIGRVYIDTAEEPVASTDPFQLSQDALSAETDCTPPE